MKLTRRTADAYVGSLVVVSPVPICCLVLCLLYGFKDILTQPLVADGTHIAFDAHVLLGLARLYVLKLMLHFTAQAIRVLVTYFRPFSTRIVCD